MTKKWCYHWTHKRNLTRILRYGLDPEKSEGKQPKVWMAEYSRIAWALAHVSQSHGWDADDMICLRVCIDHVEIRRTAMDCVYTTEYLITPLQIDGILRSIGTEWEVPTHSHQEYRDAVRCREEE